jgi:hypothetical protein
MNMPAEEIEQLNTEAQNAVDKANGNPTAPDAVEESEVSEDMWADINADLDEDDSFVSESEVSEEVITQEEPAPEPAPVVEEPSATPPAEELKPQEPAPVAELPVGEVAPPQPETPPQEPPAVQTPPQPTMSPEEYKKHQHETRAKAVEEMAKNYSLNDEDATMFLTDPGAVVPKFRAELFMDVFDATANAVLRAIPDLIKQVQTQEVAHSQQEDAFYEANPLLDKTKHSEMVNRYANAYVQAVPNTTPEQLVRDVGIQVMFALGIDPNQVKTTEEVVNDAAPSVPSPHVPAGAGAASGGNNPDPHKGNIWSEIAADLDEDD